MGLKSARACFGIPNHRTPQSSGESPAQIHFEPVADDHAFYAGAHGPRWRHPKSGVTRGTGGTVNAWRTLQGFDAVAITQTVSTIDARFYKWNGGRMTPAKERAPAPSVMEGVPSNRDFHRGQGRPIPPCSDP